MATGGLYGSTSTGTVAPQSGSESVGLYGNNTVFGGTYFEYFVFQESATAPATPTGGSWSFLTNVGTPPTGWSNTPPAAPATKVWASIALVNSKSTATLTWSVPGQFAASGAGTVTSVAALTLGTTGTDVSSTVANPTTTPVITLNLPTASATNRGLLSSADWTTFNSKGTGTVTSVSGTTGRVTSTGGTTPVIDLASGITTPGTTGSSALVPVVTVDTYGRVTSITTAANPQGTVTSVTGTAPVVSSGGATPAISMAAATASTNGYLTSTDWTTFNSKGSGSVTSVAATVPSFLSVSGSPITTSGTLAISYSGTALPVANGGTGVTVSSGANSVVLRDANVNISANSISEGYSNVAAAGTTTTLTVASVPNYVVTGSGGQTYQLPDATTLPNGVNYTFNNNQSSGTIVVKNNSGTTIATIQSGGLVDVSLLSNSIAAGSWDVHNLAPANVSWSTNTLDYPGSITSATWNGVAVAINRGGTGQTTQSAGFNALSPITSTGDLIIGNGTNSATRLAIGTSGYVLTSNGTTATWSASTGGVTSVTGTAPVVSSGGSTPAISLAASYGDTQNPYASKTANYVLAAPNGTAGVPTFRAIVAADIPTLNQNTTGTAANITATSNSTLTTLSGLSLPYSQLSGVVPTWNQNTTGTASNVTGTVAIANGGTGLTTTPANGALDIGNGTGFTRTTLTAGSGISITNASGAITIAASGGGTQTSIANGTSNVSIASSNGVVTVATNGSTAVTVDTSQNVTLNSTGALTLPVGTTAQQPTAVTGMIRFNSTKTAVEEYNGTYWASLLTGYTVNYLVVAGGGGAGIASGGGGAGGMLTGNALTLAVGTAYAVTVGAGGTGSITVGTSGNNSVFAGITAIAGGASGSSASAGTAGGSGGGGGAGAPGFAGGAGTAGQGNAGGASFGSANFGTGGGGGAGAVGTAGTSSTSGAGGVGLTSSISGSSVYYAGGGGAGGINGTTNGAGGTGGGGTGGVFGGANGVSGTANTGGGGGGGANSGGTTGGNGGSGVVIISYAGSQRGTGGTVTSSGGNTIHTFTSSGTYTA